MQDEKPDNDTLEKWHKDPSNWILGIFYFNQKDKRLFVPKRLSLLGITVNFANPASYLTLIGLTVLIVVLLKFSKTT